MKGSFKSWIKELKKILRDTGFSNPVTIPEMSPQVHLNVIKIDPLDKRKFSMINHKKLGQNATSKISSSR
jgi:hypothetical protein